MVENLKHLVSRSGDAFKKVLTIAPVVIGMALVGTLFTGLGFLAVLIFTDSSSPSTNADGYFADGLEQKRMPDWQSAIRYFTLAIEADPDRYDSLAERGMGYLVIGEKTLATADFQQSLKIEGGSGYCRGLALRRLGELLERPELFTAALVEFERAVSEEPRNSDVWISRGVLTRRMVELGTWIPETLLMSEADLMHAVNLAPNYYDAHLELAKTRRLIRNMFKQP